MVLYGLPVLFACFLWWFSTGVIFYLDGLPQRTFRWSMLGAAGTLILALYGLAVSASDTTVTGAYLAFASGLLIWGWQEISFYMGYLTGPRRHACEPGCSGWRHFGHALQVSLYHELSIVVSAAVMLAITWGEPNQVGVWTFAILCVMHQSARLNVFLGVRNLNAEFLPAHLDYLRSFLTQRPMNLLFPISVSLATWGLVVLIQNATAPGVGEFEATGITFVAALLALAILEHWFLVLPLPFAALWNWSLRSREVGKAPESKPIQSTFGIIKPGVLEQG